MNQRFADTDVIPKYGKALREGKPKTIVDLNETVQINFNFQIQHINDMVTEFGGIMPPNRMSHYIMALITHGSGQKTVGGHHFEIEPRMAILFPKKVIHSTNKWTTDTTGYMLSFDESLFEGLQFPISFLSLSQLFSLSIKPYKVFGAEVSQKAVTLFQELLRFTENDGIIDKKIFILKLSELILLYHKEFIDNQEKPIRKSRIFEKFVDLVETNFRKHKEVGYYATLLSVQANHLNKVVRSKNNVTAKDYIQQRIFLEARYLLSATNASIKEIAYDLGYVDYNYFSRLFKKVVGKTPLQYRNQRV